jgi:hypothetical protein
MSAYFPLDTRHPTPDILEWPTTLNPLTLNSVT